MYGSQQNVWISWFIDCFDTVSPIDKAKILKCFKEYFKTKYHKLNVKSITKIKWNDKEQFCCDSRQSILAVSYFGELRLKTFSTPFNIL